MLKKKQVLTMISIAVMSFILGTTFNAKFMVLGSDEYGVPFAKIWEAIYDLQGRVENIEEFTNETFRVEFLHMKITELEIKYYYYTYGVSGHWNVSKIQTEPIIEKLNSTLSGVGSIRIGGFHGNPFENQGYEVGVRIGVDRELSEAEIETVRLLIEEYLAKP